MEGLQDGTCMYIIMYITCIKQLNKIILKNEVGMAGSKSTQTRDNRIYFTSLRLLFSTIMHILIMVDVFVECGMWEIFMQVVP